jgi:hypothetical protein
VNIQTVVVPNYYKLKGENWQYTEEQKRHLVNAWKAVADANVDGVLAGMSFTNVLEPVVEHVIKTHTSLDSDKINGGYDTAVWCFACCVRSGTTPEWQGIGETVAYHVGSGIYDTKEKAAKAYINSNGATVGLLLEMVEWLMEGVDDE